jgi:hypothetical protein
MSETGHPVILEIEEIEKYQFVDVPILITANLIDTALGQRKCGETSNVKVLLAFEGNASVEHRCREHHPNLLEVISNSGIQEDGTAKIEIRIKDVSMNHDNQKFVVYLEAYRPHGENNIICALSNPITCVRHKLVLSEAYTAPYIWYKDEGAKDKCIRILVKLIDSNKQLVKDRNVVLIPNLIYSSGLSVQPATVLNLFHDRDKPFMIGHNGSDVIRFRVNEVSRNHRKQLFHLLVQPDLISNPSLADISPAISLAFEVKSKRTSDAKKEHFNSSLVASSFLNSGGINKVSSNGIIGDDDDDSEDNSPMLKSASMDLQSPRESFGNSKPSSTASSSSSMALTLQSKSNENLLSSHINTPRHLGVGGDGGQSERSNKSSNKRAISQSLDDGDNSNSLRATSNNSGNNGSFSSSSQHDRLQSLNTPRENDGGIFRPPYTANSNFPPSALGKKPSDFFSSLYFLSYLRLFSRSL